MSAVLARTQDRFKNVVFFGLERFPAFGRLGEVMSLQELSELYQHVKERRTELIIVGEARTEVTPAVATKLRRYNGLLDIWKASTASATGTPSHFDGLLDTNLPVDELKEKLSHILFEKELLERYGIVSHAATMKVVARTISRVAPTDITVLIVGASGTGKELVARALHSDSARSNKPFVAINCGALAEGVLESELFGHERGAFTGSVGKREGLFHKAEGGTLFLDEIGEMKPDLQVKLLRVLEDGTYYPVGSSAARTADVRIVAATNRDLSDDMADRKFREDLYFRISVVKIVLPPLVERKGDIQALLRHFWRSNPNLQYADTALDLLMRYDWPGNIRQLRNFCTRMAALKPDGLVKVEDVERFLTEQQATATHLPVSTGRTAEEAGQELIYRAILSLGSEVRMLRDLITSNLPGKQSVAKENATADSLTTVDEMEKMLIERTLAETAGNRKEAARRLGIGERTLYRKLTKYELS